MTDFFGMVLDVLNAIFNPILALDPNPQNPALTVVIVAFIVSLITNIANKYLVDQDKVNESQKSLKNFLQSSEKLKRVGMEKK